MTDVFYYRYDNVRRSTGYMDAWGDWVPGKTYTVVVLSTYRVVKKTPKGAWLTNGKFVLDGSGKRGAHATKELALESFIARKKRQALLLESQLASVKNALAIAERGVDCHEPCLFGLVA